CQVWDSSGDHGLF
nr:immunoglobulin light chain junction region [Macaca mulatta]MPN66503.1 immunoglobulin light chain junction region [Macaca mulatta]MPN67964.1 immunoglobulin light chain junction region [Macaca mulatta]